MVWKPDVAAVTESDLRLGSRMSYALRVSKTERRNAHYGENYWVRDRYSDYVPSAERGLWPTREEAAQHRMEPWEEIVEVADENRI